MNKWLKILAIPVGLSAVTISAWQLNNYRIKAHEFRLAESVLGQFETTVSMGSDPGKSNIHIDTKKITALRDQILTMRTLSEHGKRVQQDLLKVIDTEETMANHPIVGTIKAAFTIQDTVQDLDDNVFMETGRHLILP